jgi:hypothetical protein
MNTASYSWQDKQGNDVSKHPDSGSNASQMVAKKTIESPRVCLGVKSRPKAALQIPEGTQSPVAQRFLR